MAEERAMSGLKAAEEKKASCNGEERAQREEKRAGEMTSSRYVARKFNSVATLGISGEGQAAKETL
jgi:hypothetical protein